MRMTLFIFSIWSTACWPLSSLAEENGFWTEVLIKAYSPLHRNPLNDGKTSYDTNAYQEGCAADRRYYPEGTRIYVSWSQNGKKKGRWFTVDDTHPKTVGKKNLIYLRFLTQRSADSWKDGQYRVHVVLPSIKVE